MTHRNKVRKVIECLDIKRINNAFVYKVETSCSEFLVTLWIISICVPTMSSKIPEIRKGIGIKIAQSWKII